jgi:hypothetical protein
MLDSNDEVRGAIMPQIAVPFDTTSGSTHVSREEGIIGMPLQNSVGSTIQKNPLTCRPKRLPLRDLQLT